MAMRYLTVSNIRSVSGISSTLISDADLDVIGSLGEYESERELNTVFTPTTVIESFEGDGSSRVFLKRNPVLKVRALRIQGIDVTPANTRVVAESGVLWLTSSAEQTIVTSKSTTPYNNTVKYDFGMLDATTTVTSTTGASVAGTSIVLAVSSSTGFTTSAYAKIEGMDGLSEVFKVSTVGTGTITADALSWPHESGSTVTLLQVPQIAVEYMTVVAALMGIASIVGLTYTNVLSYTVGELNVQKGHPMEAWKESAEQLRTKLEMMKRAFRVRPAIA